jgi:hypothetical protein
MSRTVPVFLLMSVAVSLAASPVVLRPGDPTLDGKDYLISDGDFRAIVSAARACLKSKAPALTARRVHVISEAKVEVYLGPTDAYGEKGSLDVQRTKDGWKLVWCGAPERVIFDH